MSVLSSLETSSSPASPSSCRKKPIVCKLNILFNHFQSKCFLRHRPLIYEWHCSHACTLVMGRTLDLPSVIELAPCKYKRVYFYFGVQKKLITY